MSKKEEEIVPEVVEEVKPKKEDAPHQAFREVMELYAKQNPVKFLAKQAEFERKLGRKLAFALAADGVTPLDGRVDPSNGKRSPVEIVEVK